MLDAPFSFINEVKALFSVSLSMSQRTLRESSFVADLSDKQLYLTLFQFLFSYIYADVLNEVLSNRRKRTDLTKKEHTKVKN